ncbi:unnamed protein product [Lymnaea stagnalis]|uniref:Uncharacterized protein n=1 Tax=Lymnaea stagnalis TaxID=6523 RepID=A0AAV2I2G4_LYMST
MMAGRTAKIMVRKNVCAGGKVRNTRANLTVNVISRKCANLVRSELTTLAVATSDCERDVKEICKPGELRTHDISSATSDCERDVKEICKPGALRTHYISSATSDCERDVKEICKPGALRTHYISSATSDCERDIKEICKPSALRTHDISSATSDCELDVKEICKPGALRTHDISSATSDCSTFEVTNMTKKISRTRSSNAREDRLPNVTFENLRQITVSTVTKMNADKESCEKTHFEDRLFTICCPHEATVTTDDDISKTHKGEDNNITRSNVSDVGDTGMSLTVRNHSKCDSLDAAEEAKDLFPENIPTAGVIRSRSPHRSTPCATQSQSSRSPISYLPNTEKPQRRRPMRRSVSDVALPGMRYGASFFGFVSDSKFHGRKDNIDPDDEDDFTVDLDQMMKQLERGRSRKPTRNEWGNIIGTGMHHGGSESTLNTGNGDGRQHSKARSSVSSRSGSTSSDRLRIRRCALADPERMIMSQEDRERIEREVQKRRQSMVRKVSQFFNVQLGLNQEEDLI